MSGLQDALRCLCRKTKYPPWSVFLFNKQSIYMYVEICYSLKISTFSY